MLLSLAPKLARVGVLVNPVNPVNAAMLKTLRAAAQSTKVAIMPVEARSAQELATAFAAMAQQSAGALIVPVDGLFIDQARQIAALAQKYRLPSIAANPEYAEAGGLISYGQNFADNYARAAVYVDKILKGAKPGDIPLEQPARLALIINRKTATALGLTIPDDLMVRVDRIIEK